MNKKITEELWHAFTPTVGDIFSLIGHKGKSRAFFTTTCRVLKQTSLFYGVLYGLREEREREAIGTSPMSLLLSSSSFLI